MGIVVTMIHKPHTDDLLMFLFCFDTSVLAFRVTLSYPGLTLQASILADRYICVFKTTHQTRITLKTNNLRNIPNYLLTTY